MEDFGMTRPKDAPPLSQPEIDYLARMALLLEDEPEQLVKDCTQVFVYLNEVGADTWMLAGAILYRSGLTYQELQSAGVGKNAIEMIRELRRGATSDRAQTVRAATLLVELARDDLACTPVLRNLTEAHPALVSAAWMQYFRALNRTGAKPESLA
jgi:hypothetical protein